jgi:hypothetical protein
VSDLAMDAEQPREIGGPLPGLEVDGIESSP